MLARVAPRSNIWPPARREKCACGGAPMMRRNAGGRSACAPAMVAEIARRPRRRDIGGRPIIYENGRARSRAVSWPLGDVIWRWWRRAHAGRHQKNISWRCAWPSKWRSWHYWRRRPTAGRFLSRGNCHQIRLMSPGERCGIEPWR